MRIAVAGGTGTVGRFVVSEAETRGHDVVVLSRSNGVDLLTGTGAPAALVGVQAVIDVTNAPTQKRAEAEAFFGGVTATLLEAGSAAGVGHHVALSIIGIDRVPSGYYRGKLRQERLIEDGAVPWTILRAAQLHEFAEQALSFVRIGPFSLVPQMTSQPIAAREVAAALVTAADDAPQGRAPELAGPERLSMVDLAKQVNRARGRGRRVVGVRLPGAVGAGMRSGALCPTGDGPRGVQTFEEWLRG